MNSQEADPRGGILIGLYGAGGFGREVMPLLRASARTRWADSVGVRVCFIETSPRVTTVNGVAVMSEDEFFSTPAAERHFNVAVGQSALRRDLADRCEGRGGVPFDVRSEHSIVYDCNSVGDGLVSCAHTVITSNARIGKFFQANIGSYVAHDCVVGDYVTFAPYVKCNGNVHIGDMAYIGAGAVLKPGTSTRPLRIGAGAVVGMGAVVTRDVSPGETVVGNPARPLVRSV